MQQQGASNRTSSSRILDQQWESIAELMRVCSSIRMEILWRLTSGPTRVEDLALEMELAPNHISYHLAELRRHQLVVFMPRATERYYSLTDRVHVGWENNSSHVKIEASTGCSILLELAVGRR